MLKFWEGGDLLPIRSFPVSFVLAEHLRTDTHHHFYAIIEKFQNNFTYDKYGCRYPLPRSPEMSPVTKDPGNGRITTQIIISENLSTQLQKLVEIHQFRKKDILNFFMSFSEAVRIASLTQMSASANAQAFHVPNKKLSPTADLT